MGVFVCVVERVKKKGVRIKETYLFSNYILCMVVDFEIRSNQSVYLAEDGRSQFVHEHA